MGSYFQENISFARSNVSGAVFIVINCWQADHHFSVTEVLFSYALIEDDSNCSHFTTRDIRTCMPSMCSE